MTVSFEGARRAHPRRVRLAQAVSMIALGVVLTSGWSARAAAADSDAAASTGSVDEVTVTAHKASSVEAALQEKKSDIAVTSVMSAEEISERPGGNIVDIVSHLPGLSGYSDMGLGQAATGEQEYITIRGIDSSYNAYTLNGIRAPQADPGSRALSLKLIAPYGLESVKVVKTPTADMDGDAIGGIIDIRTPTAFDFPKAMTKVTVEGDLAELANKLGAKSGGGAAQGELARRFGPGGAFGVYATAYYDVKNSAGESVESTGYVPTLASENGITDFSKVHGLSSSGIRYDYYNDKITRYGGNFSLDWQTQNQSLYLQGSYGHYGVTGDDNQHAIIDGVVSLYGNGTSFSPVGILPGSYYQERDETEQLGTLKLGGKTKADRLTLEYEASAGYSQIARPNYVEGSLYGVPNLTGSALIDTSNPAHNGVTYDSAATQAYALSQNIDHLWKYQGSDSATTNIMYTGKVDADYKVQSGVLENLKGGVDVNISDRDQYQHQFFGNNGDNFVILGPQGQVEPFTNGAGPSVANMPGRNLSSFLNGAYGGVFKAYDRSVFVNGVLPHKYTSQFGIDPTTGLIVGNPGAYTQNDYMRNTVRGSEKIYAAYGMADFRLGDLQAIAGLRYEYTDFQAKVWAVDGTTGGFQSNSHTYGEVLPSLNLVYRLDQSLVFRAAIRKSFARPAYGLIASPTVISRNDLTDQIVGISQGNPNLKPAEAVNYDASVEFYGSPSTILEANVYHKDISNFIYAASSAGGYPSANIFSAPVGGVVMSQPENGLNASLTGLELDARHTLVELPGLWKGLGLGGSLTLQQSSADSGRPDHFGRKTWLPRAPQIVYNLDAFYAWRGFKADLAYQYTGLQLVGLTGNNLDNYLQPSKTLDLSVSYPVHGVTLAVAAKNLLDSVLFYKTTGKSTQYLGTQDGGGNGSYVETGRFFTISASYAW